MELISIAADDLHTHVALSGRLDGAGVEAARESFLEQTVGRQKPTIVELGEVSFLGSLGMRMLVQAAKGLHRVAADIVLLGPQELVVEALELSGLDVILPVVSSKEEALRKLGLE